MKSNTTIDFYRTDAVYTVLRRYEFTKAEKEVIQSAILTSKKEKVDMKLIAKADTLLINVAKTREPLPETEETSNTAAILAKAQVEYSLQAARKKIANDDRDGNRIILFLAGMVVLAFLTIQLTKSYQADWYDTDYGIHTYSEAKQICQSHRDTLPTVVQMNEVYDQSNIFTRISEYIINKPYWVENGDKPMIYKIRDTKGTESNHNNLYEVKCIDSANSVF